LSGIQTWDPQTLGAKRGKEKGKAVLFQTFCKGFAEMLYIYIAGGKAQGYWIWFLLLLHHGAFEQLVFHLLRHMPTCFERW